MKTVAIILGLTMSLGLVSCSQCYECTHSIEILDQSSGQIHTDESTEEYCTVSQEEIDIKESNGYTCTRKV